MSFNFVIIYGFLHHGLSCTTISISILITVALAVTRYFIIVSPIRIRAGITVSVTVRLMVIIFIVGIVSNIPHFMIYNITDIRNNETNKTEYYLDYHGIPLTQHMKTAYDITYNVVFIAIPIFVLFYCNIFIVRELYNSRQSLRHANVDEQRQPTRTSSIVNILLIVMVLQHIICVLPSCEAFGIIQNFINTQQCSILYNKVISFLTLIELCGFAFNSLIYCALNAHYRKCIRSIFKCLCCPKLRRQLTTFETTMLSRLNETQDVKQDSDGFDQTAIEMNGI